jgi:hypothetical protein
MLQSLIDVTGKTRSTASRSVPTPMQVAAFLVRPTVARCHLSVGCSTRTYSTAHTAFTLPQYRYQQGTRRAEISWSLFSFALALLSSPRTHPGIACKAAKSHPPWPHSTTRPAKCPFSYMKACHTTARGDKDLLDMARVLCGLLCPGTCPASLLCSIHARLLISFPSPAKFPFSSFP